MAEGYHFMSVSTQPQLLLPDVPPDEALDFMALEITNHSESGRKNFLVRVPADRIQHLVGLVLRTSKMSKISLEDQLISIIGTENGRTVRRYVSGQTHMAWPTYQRILIWALSEGWIQDYVFAFLIMESFHREAAQVAVRGLKEKTRRQITDFTFTKADLISAFNAAYRTKELERGAATVSRAQTNSQFKEMAIEFGFEFD